MREGTPTGGESKDEGEPSLGVPHKSVQMQVERILASKRFVRAPSLSQLLRLQRYGLS